MAPKLYGSVVALLLVDCGSGTTIDDSCLVDLAPISSRTTVLTVGDTVSFMAHLGPAPARRRPAVFDLVILKAHPTKIESVFVDVRLGVWTPEVYECLDVRRA
ncbi:MAG: hypothetical protein ACJ8A6_11780 [Gemmatimonadales bacterium]